MAVSQTIDRLSPTPYYEQLFEILQTRVLDGTYPIDHRLPSEHDLCGEFGLSRATVRQTLSELESAGYAHRVARRGVFAAAPEEPSGWILQDIEGFLESQTRHGRTGISTKVLSTAFVAAPQHASDALRLPRDEQVVALERVRSLNGETVLWSTNWFPAQAGRVVLESPEVLSGEASLNSTLHRAGFVTAAAKRVIHALPAPELIAAHLGITTDHPLLRIRSQSWDRNDRRFDYHETWLHTGLVPLEVNVSTS